MTISHTTMHLDVPRSGSPSTTLPARTRSCSSVQS